MKKLVLLLLVVSIFFSFTSERKQKRQILNDVNQYKEWVIEKSRFDLTHEELMSLLDSYFSDHGYFLESTGLNELNYIKEQAYTHRYKVHEPSIKRDVIMVETIKDGVSTWHQQWISTPYDETVTKSEVRYESVKVSIQYERIIDGYKVSTQKHNGHQAKCDFNSGEFRRFLYNQTYGANIPLPDSLVNRIKDYNASAKSKNKIYFN